MSGVGITQLYRGILPNFMKAILVSDVGITRLYRSILPNFMKAIPACSISNAVYEKTRAD